MKGGNSTSHQLLKALCGLFVSTPGVTLHASVEYQNLIIVNLDYVNLDISNIHIYIHVDMFTVCEDQFRKLQLYHFYVKDCISDMKYEICDVYKAEISNHTQGTTFHWSLN